MPNLTRTFRRCSATFFLSPYKATWIAVSFPIFSTILHRMIPPPPNHPRTSNRQSHDPSIPLARSRVTENPPSRSRFAHGRRPSVSIDRNSSMISGGTGAPGGSCGEPVASAPVGRNASPTPPPGAIKPRGPPGGIPLPPRATLSRRHAPQRSAKFGGVVRPSSADRVGFCFLPSADDRRRGFSLSPLSPLLFSSSFPPLPFCPFLSPFS